LIAFGCDTPNKISQPPAEPEQEVIPQQQQTTIELPPTETPETSVIDTNDTETQLSVDAEPEIIESPISEEPNESEQITPQADSPQQEESSAKIFHDKCISVFSVYVNENGMVDYRILKQQRYILKELLADFAAFDPNEYNNWSREDKIAFWINGYNLQMLNIIIENYPIESKRINLLWWYPTSIRHIEGDIEGIWNNYKFLIMDEQFSLSEVENNIFRVIFDEPQVFLALSRASLSSPPLRNEPYYGDRLTEQLKDQAERFTSDPKSFKIDKQSKTVYLSALFHPGLFGKDFIGKYGTDKKFKNFTIDQRAVLNFIINYLPNQEVSFLEVENYSIKYLNYDWRLNDNPKNVNR
jgi:hypothetical protein